jgi:hypothetical protein
MNTYKLKLAVFAVCGVMLLPGMTQAANIVALTDNTALFTIDFDFIAGKDGYQIPVGALQGLAFTENKDFVGYRVVGGDTPVMAKSTTNAVVLSEQKIENGMYQLAAGGRASFTLVGLFEVPETTSTEEYFVELISLPHYIGTSRVNVSESRLEQFKTDEIQLNKVIEAPLSLSLQMK